MAKQEKQAKKPAGNKPETRRENSRASATKKASGEKKTDLDFPLGKENFILMAIGFAIIVIGYILMSGDENIYSFQKITLSVIVVMFGYAFEIYAIMKRPKSENSDKEDKT